MTAMSDCADSIRNLTRSILPGRALPESVFVETWSRFLFFDCEFVFKLSFVSAAQMALAAEGSVCVTVASLEADPQELFSIMRDTSAESYRPVLNGPKPGWGWLDRFDLGRFACAPDTGSWCIYCQRNEGVGILAIRPEEIGHHGEFISRLKAASLEEQLGPNGGLVNPKFQILEDWLAQLRRNYREP